MVTALASRSISSCLIRLSNSAIGSGTEFISKRNFDAAFEYEETDGQLRAVNDVKRDMTSTAPMDRLLCGDVGFGKTEVALRAVMKAIMDGKQVAYLAPTTVLANQQALSFKSRMKDYPIKIQMISRLRSPKEQKEILNTLSLHLRKRRQLSFSTSVIRVSFPQLIHW